MQAVILAGGLGTRLRPLTYDIPKPMVPINGRPYLHYQLDYLKKQNITDILLLIGYLGEHITRYFGDGSEFGLTIQYSVEPAPMGTGGGLKLAQPYVQEEFFLIYGDSFLPLNYQQVFDFYKNTQAHMVACLYDNSQDTDVICNVAVDNASKQITAYKKNVKAPQLQYVDAGVLLMKKSVLDYIEAGRSVSLEQEIFPQLIAKQQMYGYITKERFYDIGTPERLSLAMEVLA